MSKVIKKKLSINELRDILANLKMSGQIDPKLTLNEFVINEEYSKYTDRLGYDKESVDSIKNYINTNRVETYDNPKEDSNSQPVQVKKKPEEKGFLQNYTDKVWNYFAEAGDELVNNPLQVVKSLGASLTTIPTSFIGGTYATLQAMFPKDYNNLAKAQVNLMALEQQKKLDKYKEAIAGKYGDILYQEYLDELKKNNYKGNPQSKENFIKGKQNEIELEKTVIGLQLSDYRQGLKNTMSMQPTNKFKLLEESLASIEFNRSMTEGYNIATDAVNSTISYDPALNKGASEIASVIGQGIGQIGFGKLIGGIGAGKFRVGNLPGYSTGFTAITMAFPETVRLSSEFYKGKVVEKITNDLMFERGINEKEKESIKEEISRAYDKGEIRNYLSALKNPEVSLTKATSDAGEAALLGGLVGFTSGMSESLPVGKMIDRSLLGASNIASKTFNGSLSRLANSRLGNVLKGSKIFNKEVLTETLEEGGQEMFQGAWEDVSKNLVYGEHLDISNVEEWIKGGFLGAFGGTTMSVFSNYIGGRDKGAANSQSEILNVINSIADQGIEEHNRNSAINGILNVMNGGTSTQNFIRELSESLGENEQNSNVQAGLDYGTTVLDVLSNPFDLNNPDLQGHLTDEQKKKENKTALSSQLEEVRLNAYNDAVKSVKEDVAKSVPIENQKLEIASRAYENYKKGIATLAETHKDNKVVTHINNLFNGVVSDSFEIGSDSMKELFKITFDSFDTAINKSSYSDKKVLGDAIATMHSPLTPYFASETVEEIAERHSQESSPLFEETEEGRKVVGKEVTKVINKSGILNDIFKNFVNKFDAVAKLVQRKVPAYKTAMRAANKPFNPTLTADIVKYLESFVNNSSMTTENPEFEFVNKLAYLFDSANQTTQKQIIEIFKQLKMEKGIIKHFENNVKKTPSLRRRTKLKVSTFESAATPEAVAPATPVATPVPIENGNQEPAIPLNANNLGDNGDLNEVLEANVDEIEAASFEERTEEEVDNEYEEPIVEDSGIQLPSPTELFPAPLIEQPIVEQPTSENAPSVEQVTEKQLTEQSVETSTNEEQDVKDDFVQDTFDGFLFPMAEDLQNLSQELNLNIFGAINEYNTKKGMIKILRTYDALGLLKNVSDEKLKEIISDVKIVVRNAKNSLASYNPETHVISVNTNMNVSDKTFEKAIGHELYHAITANQVHQDQVFVGRIKTIMNKFRKILIEKNGELTKEDEYFLGTNANEITETHVLEFIAGVYSNTWRVGKKQSSAVKFFNIGQKNIVDRFFSAISIKIKKTLGTRSATTQSLADALKEETTNLSNIIQNNSNRSDLKTTLNMTEDDGLLEQTMDTYFGARSMITSAYEDIFDIVGRYSKNNSNNAEENKLHDDVIALLKSVNAAAATIENPKTNVKTKLTPEQKEFFINAYNVLDELRSKAYKMEKAKRDAATQQQKEQVLEQVDKALPQNHITVEKIKALIDKLLTLEEVSMNDIQMKEYNSARADLLLLYKQNKDNFLSPEVQEKVKKHYSVIENLYKKMSRELANGIDFTIENALFELNGIKFFDALNPEEAQRLKDNPMSVEESDSNTFLLSKDQTEEPNSLSSVSFTGRVFQHLFNDVNGDPYDYLGSLDESDVLSLVNDIVGVINGLKFGKDKITKENLENAVKEFSQKGYPPLLYKIAVNSYKVFQNTHTHGIKFDAWLKEQIVDNYLSAKNSKRYSVFTFIWSKEKVKDENGNESTVIRTRYQPLGASYKNHKGQRQSNRKQKILGEMFIENINKALGINMETIVINGLTEMPMAKHFVHDPSVAPKEFQQAHENGKDLLIDDPIRSAMFASQLEDGSLIVFLNAFGDKSTYIGVKVKPEELDKLNAFIDQQALLMEKFLQDNHPNLLQDFHDAGLSKHVDNISNAHILRLVVDEIARGNKIEDIIAGKYTNMDKDYAAIAKYGFHVTETNQWMSSDYIKTEMKSKYGVELDNDENKAVFIDKNTGEVMINTVFVHGTLTKNPLSRIGRAHTGKETMDGFTGIIKLVDQLFEVASGKAKSEGGWKNYFYGKIQGIPIFSKHSVQRVGGKNNFMTKCGENGVGMAMNMSVEKIKLLQKAMPNITITLEEINSGAFDGKKIPLPLSQFQRLMENKQAKDEFLGMGQFFNSVSLESSIFSDSENINGKTAEEFWRELFTTLHENQNNKFLEFLNTVSSSKMLKKLRNQAESSMNQLQQFEMEFMQALKKQSGDVGVIKIPFVQRILKNILMNDIRDIARYKAKGGNLLLSPDLGVAAQDRLDIIKNNIRLTTMNNLADIDLDNIAGELAGSHPDKTKDFYYFKERISTFINDRKLLLEANSNKVRYKYHLDNDINLEGNILSDAERMQYETLLKSTQEEIKELQEKYEANEKLNGFIFKQISNASTFKNLANARYKQVVDEETGMLKYGYGMLSADAARKYGVKTGDRVIISVTPASSEQDISSIEIVGILDEETMPSGSAIANSTWVQNQGKDFDWDKLNVMVYDSDIFTPEQWNEFNDRVKEIFYTSVNTFINTALDKMDNTQKGKVLKPMLDEELKTNPKATIQTVEDKLRDRNNSTFDERLKFLSEEAKIEYMKSILGATEHTGKRISPTSKEAINLSGMYKKNVGFIATFRKTTSKVSRYFKPSKSKNPQEVTFNDIRLAGMIQTNAEVDFPKDTTKLFYNCSPSDFQELFYRYMLSKKAVMSLEEIQKLIEKEGNNFTFIESTYTFFDLLSTIEINISRGKSPKSENETMVLDDYTKYIPIQRKLDSQIAALIKSIQDKENIDISSRRAMKIMETLLDVYDFKHNLDSIQYTQILGYIQSGFKNKSGYNRHYKTFEEMYKALYYFVNSEQILESDKINFITNSSSTPDNVAKKLDEIINSSKKIVKEEDSMENHLRALDYSSNDISTTDDDLQNIPSFWNLYNNSKLLENNDFQKIFSKFKNYDLKVFQSIYNKYYKILNAVALMKDAKTIVSKNSFNNHLSALINKFGNIVMSSNYATSRMSDYSSTEKAMNIEKHEENFYKDVLLPAIVKSDFHMELDSNHKLSTIKTMQKQDEKNFTREDMEYFFSEPITEDGALPADLWISPKKVRKTHISDGKTTPSKINKVAFQNKQGQIYVKLFAGESWKSNSIVIPFNKETMANLFNAIEKENAKLPDNQKIVISKDEAKGLTKELTDRIWTEAKEGTARKNRMLLGNFLTDIKSTDYISYAKKMKIVADAITELDQAYDDILRDETLTEKEKTILKNLMHEVIAGSALQKRPIKAYVNEYNVRTLSELINNELSQGKEVTKEQREEFNALINEQLKEEVSIVRDLLNRASLNDTTTLERSSDPSALLLELLLQSKHFNATTFLKNHAVVSGDFLSQEEIAEKENSGKPAAELGYYSDGVEYKPIFQIATQYIKNVLKAFPQAIQRSVINRNDKKALKRVLDNLNPNDQSSIDLLEKILNKLSDRYKNVAITNKNISNAETYKMFNEFHIYKGNSYFINYLKTDEGKRVLFEYIESLNHLLVNLETDKFGLVKNLHAFFTSKFYLNKTGKVFAFADTPNEGTGAKKLPRIDLNVHHNAGNNVSIVDAIPNLDYESVAISANGEIARHHKSIKKLVGIDYYTVHVPGTPVTLGSVYHHLSEELQKAENNIEARVKDGLSDINIATQSLFMGSQNTLPMTNDEINKFYEGIASQATVKSPGKMTSTHYSNVSGKTFNVVFNYDQEGFYDITVESMHADPNGVIQKTVEKVKDLRTLLNEMTTASATTNPDERLSIRASEKSALIASLIGMHYQMMYQHYYPEIIRNQVAYVHAALEEVKTHVGVDTESFEYRMDQIVKKLERDFSLLIGSDNPIADQDYGYFPINISEKIARVHLFNEVSKTIFGQSKGSRGKMFWNRVRLIQSLGDSTDPNFIGLVKDKVLLRQSILVDNTIHNKFLESFKTQLHNRMSEILFEQFLFDAQVNQESRETIVRVQDWFATQSTSKTLHSAPKKTTELKKGDFVRMSHRTKNGVLIEVSGKVKEVTANHFTIQGYTDLPSGTRGNTDIKIKHSEAYLPYSSFKHLYPISPGIEHAGKVSAYRNQDVLKYFSETYETLGQENGDRLSKLIFGIGNLSFHGISFFSTFVSHANLGQFMQIPSTATNLIGGTFANKESGGRVKKGSKTAEQIRAEMQLDQGEADRRRDSENPDVQFRRYVLEGLRAMSIIDDDLMIKMTINAEEKVGFNAPVMSANTVISPLMDKSYASRVKALKHLRESFKSRLELTNTKKYSDYAYKLEKFSDKLAEISKISDNKKRSTEYNNIAVTISALINQLDAEGLDTDYTINNYKSKIRQSLFRFYSDFAFFYYSKPESHLRQNIFYNAIAEALSLGMSASGSANYALSKTAATHAKYGAPDRPIATTTTLNKLLTKFNQYRITKIETELNVIKTFAKQMIKYGYKAMIPSYLLDILGSNKGRLERKGIAFAQNQAPQNIFQETESKAVDKLVKSFILNASLWHINQVFLGGLVKFGNPFWILLFDLAKLLLNVTDDDERNDISFDKTSDWFRLLNILPIGVGGGMATRIGFNAFESMEFFEEQEKETKKTRLTKAQREKIEKMGKTGEVLKYLSENPLTSNRTTNFIYRAYEESQGESTVGLVSLFTTTLLGMRGRSRKDYEGAELWIPLLKDINLHNKERVERSKRSGKKKRPPNPNLQ